MGADTAVHVQDEAIAGSDAFATARVLAAAITKLGEQEAIDLVLMGMAGLDSLTSLVPSALAAYLGLPQVTLAAELTVDGQGSGASVTAQRNLDVAEETVRATLPVVVSITDQINEPRYPSFKGIMAAKKKPVTTWDLADLDVDPVTVGATGSWTEVTEVHEVPARAPGEIINDAGDGGVKLVDFLAGHKFV